MTDSPRPPAVRRRWPWIALGLAVLLAALLAAGTAWLLGSAGGVAFVVRTIDALLPERVTATGIRGAFATGIEVDEFRMNAIDAALAFGPRGAEVRRFAADIAGNRLTVVGTLGPERPFPIDAGGTLVSRLVVGGGAEPPGTRSGVDAPVQATWRALESLEQLELNAGVTGGPGYAARGALRLRIASFATEALQSLDADVAGIDPAAWLAGAPQADLQLQAQLQPVAADRFTLSGPIQVFNRRPGPLDSGRIPLRELRGRLTAHAGALALDEARAARARRGLRALCARLAAAGRTALGRRRATRRRGSGDDPRARADDERRRPARRAVRRRRHARAGATARARRARPPAFQPRRGAAHRRRPHRARTGAAAARRWLRATDRRAVAAERARVFRQRHAARADSGPARQGGGRAAERGTARRRRAAAGAARHAARLARRQRAARQAAARAHRCALARRGRGADRRRPRGAFGRARGARRARHGRRRHRTQPRSRTERTGGRGARAAAARCRRGARDTFGRLARAAVGLLGGSGEGVPTQLARRLGIDEFSIRTAEVAGSGSLLPRQSVAGRVRGDSTTLGGEIVTIGKRLSDELTLSYEQATTGTSNVVQLSYRLTQRLSVIGRAGTDNALDLVYSFAFD